MNGHRLFVETPAGVLLLSERDGYLVQAQFTGQAEEDRSSALLENAASQIGEFFNGQRRNFDLPFMPEGTPFQQQVWAAVAAVPFGKTSTYGTLAQRLGNTAAIRAVGTANGANPLAIFIPCHRIVGAKGELTGYAWGLERKQWLLDHEARIAYGKQTLF